MERINRTQSDTNVQDIWYYGMPIQDGDDGKQTHYATYAGRSDFEGYVKVIITGRDGLPHLTDWKIKNTFASK